VTPAGRTLTVSHLGRVEGHGGIHVRIADGVVREVGMDVFEGSRYYEALLRGRHFLEVQGIITRVCAICSTSHTVAALTALEKALGVEPPRRVDDLRCLAELGAFVESHALHVFALALPDFLGFDSVIAMSAKFPAEVAFALKLKQLGNRVQELVSGRAIHPVNMMLGGFGRPPGAADLRAVQGELLAALDPLMAAVGLVNGIEVPDWPAQETLYVALRPKGPGYGFRGDLVCTSRGEEYPVERHADLVREYTVEHSHAKHSVLASGETYMVGSLARLKLWGALLAGRARDAFEQLFPGGVVDNVLMNSRAQLVELVHCVERAAELCEALAAGGAAEPGAVDCRPRSGRGVSAVEAPRGTLFHEYVLDDGGRVVSADVITPTAQNLANVERDVRRAAETLLARERDIREPRLERALAMVTRAYDPCISCSVH
jgi:sulfhydrogenase subunit alpha